MKKFFATEEQAFAAQLMIPFFGAVFCGGILVRLFAGIMVSLFGSGLNFWLPILSSVASICTSLGSGLISTELEHLDPEHYQRLARVTHGLSRLFFYLSLILLVIAGINH